MLNDIQGVINVFDFAALRKSERAMKKNRENIFKLFQKTLKRCCDDDSYCSKIGISSRVARDSIIHIHNYQFLVFDGWNNPIIIAFDSTTKVFFLLPTNKYGTRIKGKCLYLTNEEIRPSDTRKMSFAKLRCDQYSIFSYNFSHYVDDKYRENFEFGSDFVLHFKLDDTDFLYGNIPYIEQNPALDDFNAMVKTIFKQHFNMTGVDDVLEIGINLSPTERKEKILSLLEELKPDFENIFGTPFIAHNKFDIFDLLYVLIRPENDYFENPIIDIKEDIFDHFNSKPYEGKSYDRKLLDYFFEKLSIESKVAFIILTAYIASLDGKISLEEESLFYEYYNEYCKEADDILSKLF